MQITTAIATALCLSSFPLLFGLIVIVAIVRNKKNKVAKIILTITSTIFFIVICSLIGIIFSGAPSPLFKPSISKIEGTYFLGKASKDKLFSEGYPFLTESSYIRFFRDKSFEVQNMPDIIIDDYNFSHELLSGNGTWDLEFDTVNSDWLVSFQFTTSEDNKTSGYSSHFWIYGRKSPFILYSIIRDPDSFNWLMYHRNENDR